jgi:hypothetical protein
MIIEALVFKMMFGGLLAFGAYVFWDDLKAWTKTIVGALLDLLDLTITAGMHAVTYLIKVSGRVYRQVRLFARNKLSHSVVTVVKSEMEEVNIDDLPDTIREKLKVSTKVEVLEATVPV